MAVKNMQGMQVKRMKISELTESDYNPKDRVAEKGSHGLQGLMKSIERIGLVYPIAITKEGVVIDGHRRLHACKGLGWEEVPVLIVETDDRDRVYAEVNANSYKLSGNQNLKVWLKRPAAVTDFLAKRLEKIESDYGRPMLERLAKSGSSIRVVQLAEKIGRYTDDDSTSFIRSAVMWIIKYRGVQIASAYLRLQQSPATLYKAIKTGKELKSKFSSR